MVVTPRNCSVPDCPYVTPEGLPSHELAIRDLEVHTNGVHCRTMAQQQQHQEPKIKMPCPKWMLNQTFEAFNRDLQKWRQNC